MYSENLVRALNDIAEKYQPLIQKQVVDTLSQFKNTGAGVDSVRVEVTPGTADTAPQIRIQFADEVNIINLKKMQWTKFPNTGKLLKWAATKRSTETEIKQLAFATAAKQKKYDTWKSKSWRKKSLSEVLKEMNELVLKNFEQAIEKDWQEAINKGLAQ
jgi:hypothetical protein